MPTCVGILATIQSKTTAFSFYQGFTFGKAGEILTTRLRSMAFKAMLRQVGVCLGKASVHSEFF